MEPSYLLSLLSPRMRDRARAIAFFRFLARRTLEDNLFQAAGALAFTTVFALVPLSIVVFGVLSAFPAFASWSDQLSNYVFSHFVPGAARSVESYLRQFASNAEALTAAGIVALVVSLLVTLASVEGTFNRIWRVEVARPQLSRFLVYWTVLTLGAVFAATSLAISARFFALSVFSTEAGDVLEAVMLRLAPVFIELGAFTILYRVVPHRTIRWRHAFSGAVLATVLFEAAKWGIGAYLSGFITYSTIYKQLAFVPIFLLWAYVGWLAILLGASFASSVSAFRYQPVGERLPEGFELYGLLRLLARFREARRHGRGLHADEMQQLEPMLTDTLIQQMVAQLDQIHVLRRAETGEWLLARDLDDLTMAELYEACRLRIPIAEAHLPGRDDAVGRHALAVVDELRIHLRDLLKRRVGSLWPDKEAR